MPVHSSGDERTTDVENCYFSVQWTISYIRISVAILNIEVTQTIQQLTAGKRFFYLSSQSIADDPAELLFPLAVTPATGDLLEPLHGERLAVLGPLDLVVQIRVLGHR